ncbi:hypothetical protein MRX96_014919 [Rhipicephalus microplus]
MFHSGPEKRVRESSEQWLPKEECPSGCRRRCQVYASHAPRAPVVKKKKGPHDAVCPPTEPKCRRRLRGSGFSLTGDDTAVFLADTGSLSTVGSQTSATPSPSGQVTTVSVVACSPDAARRPVGSVRDRSR